MKLSERKLIGTCKECNWYGKLHPGLDRPGDDNCGCPKFVNGYGLNEEEIPIDGIHVEDDEGWGFCVQPDFGCIHWKQAEKGEGK